MKVVIEKIDAHIISFDSDKMYLVVANYKNDKPLGVAKVTLEGNAMFADIAFNKNAKGYPAIGYVTVNESKVNYLEVIAICDSPNIDESIEPIEYTLQLEGKPSNLKTK